MKEEEENKQQIVITEGYTAGQAAVVLARNSGRPVDDPDTLKQLADLVKKLGQKGVIRSIKVNARLNLYNKKDVDGYKVEERGKKAGRAAQKRAGGSGTESKKSDPLAV
jgi:hypothetical protein